MSKSDEYYIQTENRTWARGGPAPGALVCADTCYVATCTPQIESASLKGLRVPARTAEVTACRRAAQRAGAGHGCVVSGFVKECQISHRKIINW